MRKDCIELLLLKRKLIDTFLAKFYVESLVLSDRARLFELRIFDIDSDHMSRRYLSRQSQRYRSRATTGIKHTAPWLQVSEKETGVGLCRPLRHEAHHGRTVSRCVFIC